MFEATFLVDGFVGGTWRITQKRKVASLTLTPFAPLTFAEEVNLLAEAERFIDFMAPKAEQKVVEISDRETTG